MIEPEEQLTTTGFCHICQAEHNQLKLALLKSSLRCPSRFCAWSVALISVNDMHDFSLKFDFYLFVEKDLRKLRITVN